MTNSGPLCGAVEAGGTKFVCLIGTGPGDMREQARFSTLSPEVTLRETLDFFRNAAARHGQLDAIGIASFGPIDLRLDSPTYGYITSTPKPGWANVDIAGTIRDALAVPVGFDTDVNAAALAEWRWGSAQGLDAFIYLTIGTGIGGGGLVNGRLLHGLVHPEMGHVRIPHDLDEDPFAGVCPFHGDCFEGLASGPAMNARWLQPAEQLPDDHPGWALEARYLALALVNFICALSPERIVIGGGVMSKTLLYPLIRSQVLALVNNYVRAPQLLEGIDNYIVPPWLGGHAGVLGALALAQQLVEDSETAGPQGQPRH
jgi:fructokinase